MRLQNYTWFKVQLYISSNNRTHRGCVRTAVTAMPPIMVQFPGPHGPAEHRAGSNNKKNPPMGYAVSREYSPVAECLPACGKPWILSLTTEKHPESKLHRTFLHSQSVWGQLDNSLHVVLPPQRRFPLDNLTIKARPIYLGQTIKLIR